jgi:hypothetical protein
MGDHLPAGDRLRFLTSADNTLGIGGLACVVCTIATMMIVVSPPKDDINF